MNATTSSPTPAPGGVDTFVVFLSVLYIGAAAALIGCLAIIWYRWCARAALAASASRSDRLVAGHHNAYHRAMELPV